MGLRQHAHEPGYAHGTPPDRRCAKREGLAVGLEKQGFIGQGRRNFSAIVGAHTTTGFAQNQKSPAAYAARLGFNQAQHPLRGNGGIERVAARPQNFERGSGGQGVRGRGRMPSVELFARDLAARRGFGFDGGIGLREGCA
jgi:hypothetical protein